MGPRNLTRRYHSSLPSVSPRLTFINTHTRLTALCLGLPGWAGTRKVKPNWILLKQETVSGSGISWAICKSAPCCRQITMPAPHHSDFYMPDALPAARPTASKHWSTFIKSIIMCWSLSQKWESFSAKPWVKVDGCRYLLSVNGRCFQMLWSARQPISALYAQHSSTAAVWNSWLSDLYAPNVSTVELL